MQVRRYVWLVALFLGMLLSACAGGSGSSGFDNFPSSENAAIDQALSEQQCVVFHGLSICPADTTGAATPLPTPPPPVTTATRAPTTTPTALVVNPQPTASPTPLATHRASPSPAATRTATGTPQAHEPHKPVVDTGINDGVLPCAVVDAENSCMFVIPFAPDGFPDGTAFRVAVRTVDPPSAWTISADATANGTPSAPAFDATVAIAAAPQPSAAAGHVQIAVLVFVKPPSSVPTAIANLGDSGADYAFVTTDLSVEPGT